ncbi:MAG: type II toxin-antitoxin system prevent-host-death family antitoxin [Pseudonocardiales bacterium]|nr:type II toxin-antitoxin system prevent-host-death family antitoxin [Pseudonocardiales bacterium]
MSAAAEFPSYSSSSPDELPANEVRRAFSEVVGRAQHGGHVTYITHHGRRVAAVVPADAAEYLEQLEDRALAAMAEEALAEGGEPIPWEQVRSEMSL